MKIISKFKDFYDFEVSKYGMDEKLIYKRITSEYLNMPKGKYRSGIGNYFYRHKILLVGDKTVHLFYGDRKVYSHFDLVELENLKKGRTSYGFYGGNLFFDYGEPKLLFNDGEVLSPEDKDIYFKDIFGAMLYEMLDMNRNEIIKHLKDEIFSGGKEYLIGDDFQKDKLYNEPIILLEYVDCVHDYSLRHSYRVYKRTYNPNLLSMGIYIDPEFVWQSLVGFLSRKRSDREIMLEIPNDIKIEEHGFDLKTSFRPKMNKKR